MSSALVTFSVSCPDAPTKTGSTSFTYSAAGGPGRLVLTGADTFAVDFAMFGGASVKLLLVSVDTTDNAGAAVSTPVTVRRTVNSLTVNEPLGPGDFLLLTNLTAATTTGTTALTLVSTANAVVHVIALA